MSVEVRVGRADDLPAILALRHEVFCVEQGVPPDLDQDGRDETALQLLALDDADVVGTCRLLTGEESWRLGRMAVRADRRADGIGRKLMDLAHREARAAGARRVSLAAQTPVQGFYERQGYISHGDVFMEAGIPHIRMDRELT
jgi:predicted GNAT family N-acyltransferase